MEEGKQNKLPPMVYACLVENEAQLTSYLKYIRHRPQPSKIPLSLPKFLTTRSKDPPKQKKACILVKPYVEEYLRLVREASSMESYSGRKIITKLIQYLQEFPTMCFLVETVNSFGRERKKLCQHESTILGEANDDMVPLFQKIIEKVQTLKKQADSKKLMQLGLRISHLHKMVEGMRKHAVLTDSPLRPLQQERVQKYLIMEQNISKAEKHFGKFSQNFHKNQEIFSNINRVYMQISKTQSQLRN